MAKPKKKARSGKEKAKPTKAKPAKAKPTKAKPAKAKPTKAKPTKAKAPSAELVELYEGLQTNVFETVFPKDAALIAAFLAWAKKTHPRWHEEVDEDERPVTRAIRLEMLITDEVEEAAFVAFFETLPAAQRQAAVAAMQRAEEGGELEDDEDEEQDDDDDGSVIDLSDKGLTALPDELAGKLDIKQLILRRNKLTTLPSWITNLKQLEEIDLSDNSIGVLPAELAACTSLKTLILFNCKAAVVPPIPSLRTVVAQSTSLATILSACASPGLTELNAMSSGLTEVPEAVRGLKQLTRLDLSDNRKLKALPRWLAELPIDSLYTFDTKVPESEMAWARSALRLE